MDARRVRFLEQLRHHGFPLSAALARAFASVPREAFVTAGFQRRGGAWAHPTDPDFLDLVYRDDVLITKVRGRVPVSSSSQPSLMAVMLDALDVRAGLRVLEIGTGTGYNAALLAALGAEVTSIDVQPDVAAQARAALSAAGIANVTVHHGDGYAGRPGHPFDRAVVTVGVAGLSPHWLNQLTPGGHVVAPVDHAGAHPILIVHAPATHSPAPTPSGFGPVTAGVLCLSGFMTAAGPLTAGHPGAHPAPAVAGALVDLVEVAGPRWNGPLEPAIYRDLWYAAGVWSRRASHAALPGRDQSHIALLDETGTGGAAILPDGTILAGGPEAAYYAAGAAEILDRWEAAGHPPMTAWRITLSLTGDPAAPIWVPAAWSLR